MHPQQPDGDRRVEAALGREVPGSVNEPTPPVWRALEEATPASEVGRYVWSVPERRRAPRSREARSQSGVWELFTKSRGL